MGFNDTITKLSFQLWVLGGYFSIRIVSSKILYILKVLKFKIYFPGNYYSLRSEHQKAVVNFQRALSLDPQYLSAWILMGHEFIELQNSNAAIQCYRQAIGR